MPGVLPLWWGTWLVSAMVGNAVLRSAFEDAEGIPALIRQSYVEALDGLTGVAAAVAAYFVIRAFAGVLRMQAPR